MMQESVKQNCLNYSVAAVVIIYNPPKEILNNIKTYVNQVSALFIVDNSEYFNQNISDFCESVSYCEYLPNNKNLGVAKGLNIGASKAIAKNFDYLLTMDQDSKAPENLVLTLLGIISKSDKIGIVSPLHSNIFETHNKIYGKNIEQVSIAMTSGNLISLKAFQFVGKFNENYFIDYVDIEYCLRLHINNFNIYRINDLVLEHHEGNLIKKKLLGKTFYPINNEPIRIYYKTRNLLYLIKQYKGSEKEQLKIEINVYLRNIIKLLLFEKNKVSKLKMVLNGVIDFSKGKTGKK